MWLLVGFDLPTRTKTDKRLAANFRKDLLRLGFTRLQFSLYSYYAHSKEKAESLAVLIQGLVPANGHVTIFFLTDRQFAMIVSSLVRNFDPEKSPKSIMLR